MRLRVRPRHHGASCHPQPLFSEQGTIVRKLFASLLLLSSLVACSGGGASSYVGLWQTADKTPKTVEITKDGNSYLLTDLNATDMVGRKKAPIVLTQAGEQLVFSTGYGSAPLGLSEDKNTLRFDKWTFARIPKQDAEQVKTAIEAAQVQATADAEQCKTMGKEMDEKSKEIDRSRSKDSLAVKERLRNDFYARADKIPDCKRKLMIIAVTGIL
jgi:hypothetical protein